MDWGYILSGAIASAGGIFAGVKAAPFVREGEVGVITTLGKAKRDIDGRVKLYTPGFKRIWPFVQRMERLYTENRVVNFPNFSVKLKSGLSYTFSGYVVYACMDTAEWAEYLLFGLDDIRELVVVNFEKSIQAIMWKMDELELDKANDKIKKHLTGPMAEHGIKILDCGVSGFMETAVAQSLIGVDYRIKKAIEYQGQLPDCVLMAAVGATPVVNADDCILQETEEEEEE